MLVSLLLSLLLFSEQKLDMGGKLSDNQAAIDTKEMRLVLTVDPDAKTISGFAETRYALKRDDLKVLELELVDSLRVTGVLVNGKPRPFKHGHNRLLINLPQGLKDSLVARIDYEGHPTEARRPPWDGGFNWSRTDSGQPWVGVSCQGEGGQVWYPVKGHQVDKIEGLKLEITVPEDLYCAANGLLEKIQPASEGWRTFHWRSKYPIASYNVSINIANYRIIEATYKGTKEMPVILYMLDEYQKADKSSRGGSYEDKLEDLKNMTLDCLTVLSEYYGEYPFIDEKFGLAHTAYLGMEHQTINSYGAHFFKTGGIDGLMVHEMGHEWWGNKLTVSDLADFWIQEGICTYSTGVYLEHIKGLDAALEYYQGKWYRISNAKPLVQGVNITQGQAYTGDIYNKGALVVHALRWLVGREKVNKILKDFMMDTQVTYVKTASTADLVAHAERVTGMELDWFFDRYLKVAAPPKLTWSQSDRQLNFVWDTEDFAMPIEIAITKKGAVSYERVPLENGKGTWTLEKGAKVEVDPRRWVYKKVVKE